MIDNIKYDINSDLDYKSCFARSMAVNHQYKQIEKIGSDNNNNNIKKRDEILIKDETIQQLLDVSKKETQEIRLRKSMGNNSEDLRRYSCSNLNSSMRIYSSRKPVENMMNQNKLETLHWQLKELQKSREMYREVMKQVVTYLEKVHHNLELLGSTIIRKNSIINSDDYKWKQSKSEELSIPADKLAQEAFRLRRTAESLLNTREPDLVPCEFNNDVEFLEQLAKEFPQKTQKRATSFSIWPKLIVPETTISFDRQLNDVKRTDLINDKIKSPINGSISSMEDESGFSSLNSFQDVGLPMLNSTMVEEVSTKNALLRSMLHNNNPSNFSIDQSDSLTETVVNFEKEESTALNDIKLWQKPSQHKRWNSTPVKETNQQNNIKVLWV